MLYFYWVTFYYLLCTRLYTTQKTTSRWTMTTLLLNILLVAAVGSTALSPLVANDESIRSRGSFQLNMDNLKELTLLDIALEFQKAYPDEIRVALNSLFQKDDGTMDAGKS